MRLAIAASAVQRAPRPVHGSSLPASGDPCAERDPGRSGACPPEPTDLFSPNKSERQNAKRKVCSGSRAALQRSRFLRLPGGGRHGLGHALWRRRLAHPDRRDDRGQHPKAGQRIEPAGEIPGVVLEPTDDRRRDAAAEDADRVDPGDGAAVQQQVMQSGGNFTGDLPRFVAGYGGGRVFEEQRVRRRSAAENAPAVVVDDLVGKITQSRDAVTPLVRRPFMSSISSTGRDSMPRFFLGRQNGERNSSSLLNKPTRRAGLNPVSFVAVDGRESQRGELITDGHGPAFDVNSVECVAFYDRPSPYHRGGAPVEDDTVAQIVCDVAPPSISAEPPALTRTPLCRKYPPEAFPPPTSRFQATCSVWS